MANINFPSSPTNGQQYSYGAATYVYDSTIPGWLAYPTLPGGVPAGTIVQWGTATAPANWMICDGTAISRSTYASLFNVIGTTYGAGDGSTTFNLPNLKGRVPIGLDGSQTQFTTLGQTGGNKTNALYGTGTATGYGLTYSGSMNTADDGTASNLPPYIAVNYIIKTSMANTPGDSALATRVGALETFNTQAQPVPVGGTGATSFTSGSYLKGNGTSAIQAQAGIPATDITSGALSIARGGTGVTTGAGLVPVIPTSVTVSSGTGSVDASGLITFSGVGSIAFNSGFTSAYQNYRIVVWNIQSNTGYPGITVNLRASGTNATTEYWNWGVRAVSSAGITQRGANATSGMEVISAFGSGGKYQALTMDVTTPFIASNTIMQTQSTGFDTSSAVWQSQSCFKNDAVSYDGMAFTTTANTWSGSMKVYGYN
jgi:microcystin-dependent protein